MFTESTWRSCHARACVVNVNGLAEGHDGELCGGRTEGVGGLNLERRCSCVWRFLIFSGVRVRKFFAITVHFGPTIW
jgi:hypothetical protein